MSTAEEWTVPPIEESFSFDVTDFPSFDKRYFKTYRTKKSDLSSAEDEAAVWPQLVLVHSNRLCLVCLSPEHPVVKGGNAVKKVDFQVSPRCNRLDNVVRGKGKKGAQVAGVESIMAVIETEGGDRYKVVSNVRGKIVEVNERLVAEPELVRTHPGTEGFVAMVLPKIPDGLKELRERLECVEEEDSVGQTEGDEVAGGAIS